MNLNSCKYDFASDNINIIVLVYDQSGSMSGDISAMRAANKAFYSDFSKFEEKGSIAISKAVFDEDFSMTDFDSVSKFDTSYYADGGTHLYRAIIYAVEATISYYDEVMKRLNVKPRITFLVFSDGYDTEGSEWAHTKAKESILQLNSLDATTVFVAFRDAITDESGSKLGFTCTRNIESVQELISCLGNELSKSCKEQSRSAYSLKSAFFSTANTDSDEDSVEEAAIVSDDFFNV